MTKNKSQDFRLQLRGALIQSGWEITKIEEETQWFAKDHWTIKSVRQAYGAEVIISFMIDPLDDNYTEVWSVEASTEKPMNRMVGSDVTKLQMRKGHFAEKLSAFIHDLNTHRNNIQNVPKCAKEEKEGDKNGTGI